MTGYEGASSPPKTFAKGSDASLTDLGTPEMGSGSSLNTVNEKLAPSAVYAGGGQSSRFYEPIPEYEGRHRWDPHAEWDEREEKQLVRKVS
jgi:hypothetical protein